MKTVAPAAAIARLTEVDVLRTAAVQDMTVCAMGKLMKYLTAVAHATRLPTAVRATEASAWIPVPGKKVAKAMLAHVTEVSVGRGMEYDKKDHGSERLWDAAGRTVS